MPSTLCRPNGRKSVCGISGFVGSGDRRDLEAMAGRMVHRGPDDAVFWQEEAKFGPLGMAFRRLIVLDRQGGGQPMLNETGDLVVVFNGEIYNHGELRKQLGERGHRFRSHHSDTEVLLHGYREWGEKVVEHLRGMYAFAIWDKSQSRLVAATDPFGKKPLYYAVIDGGLVFASELLSLISHRGVNCEIDRLALARFFAFGFLPQPQTPLKNVAKLGAGRVLKFEAASQRLQVQRYWQFRISAGSAGKDWRDLQSSLSELLEQAVARRLEADVPIGFLLSGGIDSALVTSLARRRLPEVQLRCFTLGFQEPSYDESEQAGVTAAALGVEHHVERFSLVDMGEFADSVLRRMDEPLADPSLLPTALLCRFARQHVTVALAGDGADELFAGYDTFAALPLAEAYSAAVPQVVHRGMLRLANLLPLSDSNLSFDFKLRRALRGLSHEEALWHAAWLAPVDIEGLSSLFGEDFSAENIYAPVLEHWSESSASYRRDRALEYYVDFYLQGDILTKLDRSSMQFSLEVRTPFLDRDLAEFCASLPYTAKHAFGVRKRLLRRVASELLPPAVLQRRKKGFGIPISNWLRALSRPELETAALLGLDPRFLDRAWSEHKQRRRDHRGLLWAWICLDRWHQTLGEVMFERRKTA